MGAPVMTTSQDAEAAINTLNADVDNLNAYVTAWWQATANKKDPKQANFVNAWMRWRNDTYSMITNSRKFWAVPDMAWSVVDRANQKTRELATWRATFERVSGTKVDVPQTEEKKDDKSDLWKLGAVAAGGALLAVVLIRR
jgi:hypothetical protein